MLTLQKAQGGSTAKQGSCAVVLAELQAAERTGAAPSGAYRQRLLDLVQRWRRVQALGGECARVELSPHVRRELARIGAA